MSDRRHVLLLFLGATASALVLGGLATATEPETQVAMAEEVTFVDEEPRLPQPTTTTAPTTTTVPPTTTTAPPPPPPPTTTTTVYVPPPPPPPPAPAPSGSCGGWGDLLAAYFPADQVGTACRVMLCESGGSTTVHNSRSSASGLWQFLDSTWRSTTGLAPPASAYSADQQTAAAARLWGSSGWSPWSCY